MRRALVLLALLLSGTISATAAAAHQIFVGDLEFIHANIHAPAASAISAAGYMAISNNGDTDDRLLGITVDFAAKATLYTSEVSADGVARMVRLNGLDLPAQGTVLLEPGGIHVMFMGLTTLPQVGDILPATLQFEKAGAVPITFMVDPADGPADGPPVDHSAHTD